MIERAHSSHIGLNACIRRAREAIFWPNMSSDITKYVQKCSICEQVQSESQREPMLSRELPSRPWQYVATDMFEFKQQSYLITVDYFSNYFEIDRLEGKRAVDIIYRLKKLFCAQGLPEKVFSDNGPPFNSIEFREFVKNYEFQHVTSSPYYAQSNGKIERSVQTAKKLMKKASVDNSDPFLALLDFRNTPSESLKLSPVQILYGRRTRTKLPIKSELLTTPDASDIQSRLGSAKVKQAMYTTAGLNQKNH